MTERDEPQKARIHARVWRKFYRKVDKILGALGRGGSWNDDADFWIVGDDGEVTPFRSICAIWTCCGPTFSKSCRRR